MTKRIGTLEVDMGSMFSGKSEELIRKVRRAKIANKKVQVFKPKTDNRYSSEEVVTHYGNAIECIVVESSLDLVRAVDFDTDLIAIDEAQFFDDELFNVIKTLKRIGNQDVTVSGLDMWASGEPVMLMAKLAAIANKVEKFNAVCVDTGDEAYISFCTVDKKGDVLVGGADKYVALSEAAWLKRLDQSR
jgi:thymidine kinase